MTGPDTVQNALAWTEELIEKLELPFEAHAEMLSPEVYDVPAEEELDAERLKDDVFDARAKLENYKHELDHDEAIAAVAEASLNSGQHNLWCSKYLALEGAIAIEDGLRGIGLCAQARIAEPEAWGISVDYSMLIEQMTNARGAEHSAYMARVSMLSGHMVLDLSKAPLKTRVGFEPKFKEHVTKLLRSCKTLVAGVLDPQSAFKRMREQKLAERQERYHEGIPF